MLMRWLWEAPKYGAEANYAIGGLELSVSHFLTPGEGRGAVKIELTAIGQLFNQLRLCNKASIKTQKDRVWGASGLVNIWKHRESDMCSENTEAPHNFHIPCPVCLFHVAISELYPVILNWWSSKKSVSLSKINLIWGWGPRNHY